MYKKLFSPVLSLALVSFLALTSCEQNEVENLVYEDLTKSSFSEEIQSEGQERHRGGKGKITGGDCYSLVYPVDLTFSDGSNETYDSQEALQTGLQSYIEANGRDGNKPSFQFPISLTLSESNETLSIADSDALKAVRQECKGSKKGERGKKCFRNVFPVSLAFPDGTTLEVADKQELKTAKKDWKENNPGTERPSILFPYDVSLEDESIVTLNNETELESLKESCNQEE